MEDFTSSDDDGERVPSVAVADVAAAGVDAAKDFTSSDDDGERVPSVAVADVAAAGVDAAMVASTPVTLQGILTNTTFHVDRERWFDLLQDDGLEMVGEEKTTYGTPVKGKRKNKHYNIAHRGRFYPKLYQLAHLCVQKIKDHPDVYPRFNHGNKNLSSIVHPLGRHLASGRKKYARADLHNIGRDVGFSDFIQSDTYAQRDCFYIYSQQNVLEHMFDKYGPEKENKKVTTDDIVRVIGILFRDEDMRSCITSMVGTAKNGTRQELDAAPAKCRGGFRLLHTRFIDKEVVAGLPEMWTEDGTMAAIEEKYGPGSFETYCIFNPNNHARISLPWTEDDMRKIFAKVLTEYNALMEKYTMGTGGGSGAPENYGDWWVRPAETVVGYIRQPAKFYLTILFMWDKQYSWIFTTEKDTLPQSCMIDDSDPTVNFNDTVDGTDGDDGGTDGDDHNFQLRRLHSPSVAVRDTPTVRGGHRGQSAPSSKRQHRMAQALETLNSGRQSMNATTTEVLGIMRRMEAANSTNTSSQSQDRQAHQLVQDIKESSSMVKEFQSDLAALRKRKRSLSADKVKNKSKLKIVKKEIKQKEEQLETMKNTSYNQSLDLKTLNEKAEAGKERNNDVGAGNGEEDTDNDSSSDDDSGDDDE